MEVITSVSYLFYHQPDVFNVSELENVPNFADTFDCLDGEVFAVSFVELQGKVSISLLSSFYDRSTLLPLAAQVQVRNS